jgi:hypothetical protein
VSLPQLLSSNSDPVSQSRKDFLFPYLRSLETSDEEVGKLMLDREAWRSRRVSKNVKENISSNSGRCRTRAMFLYSTI